MFPLKMVIFHSYVSLPEGNHHQFIFLITHPFFMPMKFDGFLAPICPIQSPFNLHISPYISIFVGHIPYFIPISQLKSHGFSNMKSQFPHDICHKEWGISMISSDFQATE